MYSLSWPLKSKLLQVRRYIFPPQEKDPEPAHLAFVYFLAFAWIQFPLRLARGVGPSSVS